MNRSTRLAAWSLALAIGPAAGADEPVSFNRDVRPILADACYHCHGPDSAKRKAGLRLDSAEGATADHEGRHAVVPGKPEESELLERIALDADDPAKMPPVASNRKLDAPQAETLRRWVAQGAKYEAHWSLVAPTRPALPSIGDEYRALNPIDAFIIDRLRPHHLTLSSKADRATLIRRASLDLIGLPPTPDEVDAYLADPSSDAYEKVVDRLLGSPHYGERMALEWLDAARYADSNGFQEDRTRTMWPWRDQLVRSLNQNQRFDQFTLEQLAGDLLPGATNAQHVASGFHRNHMLNGEGGRLPEESRIDYVVDRVDTTATVWLGLTLGCARCHDHKYDPFTQKEYYQLFAYFNNVPETGSVDRAGNAAPTARVETAEAAPRLEELRRGVAEAEGRRDAVIARGEAARREWEAGLGPAVAWTAVDPVAVKSKNGATLTRREDLSIVASGEDPIKDVHEVTIKTDAVGLTGLRLEMLADDSLPHRGPGRAPENGNFYLNRVEGEAVSVTDPSRSTPLVFTTAEADYSQPGCDVSGAIDGDPATGWASQFTPSRDLAARFGLATPVGYVGGTEIRLRFRYESVHPQHTPGRYRLSLGRGSMLPAAVAAALAVEASGRSPEQAKAVDEQWRKSLEVPVAASRRSLSDFESTLPEAMVMAERPDPRETAILIRGAWDKPGEKVSAGVPAKLPPLPADAPKNRLSLARWVVDPANPLTARVAVNRAWQTLMGTGLVKTVEDFGTQGDLPSHPELLDWLATEFVRTGWDVKALHRLIVTSGTYRQSSKVTPQLIERDPENRLLARGPRYRLSSLLLRDQALAASGLLVPTVGGPPVRPYQPPGIWEELSFGTIKYDQDAGEKLYRRSLYTYWRRTIGPTDLFDASARQTCAVRQSRTNTPIHALISLNDTAYVEAARVLAERAVAEAGQGASDRLDRLFRLAAARKPVEAERRVLIRAYERLLGQYRADPAATSKRLAVGQKPRRDPGTDAAELAALSEVAALVLNLDEVLSKE